MTIRIPLLPIEIEFRRTAGRRGRVKVRDLMILVAVAALAIHVWRTPERAALYRAEAGRHDHRYTQARLLAGATMTTMRSRFDDSRAIRTRKAEAERASDWTEVARLTREAEDMDRVAISLRSELTRVDGRANHHWGLAQKYRWAADHAYWPLWPDPTPP